MKKSYYFLFLLLISSLSSRAVIRTVCNMPYSPGQFTTFAAAMTASFNNDTIYVHGSSVNYGVANITRSGIVVIGAGHNPNKQAPLPTSFTTITVGAGFTNCQFIGLTMLNMTVVANNTVIKRCKFIDLIPGIVGISVNGFVSNMVVEGNVFAHSTGINMDINFNFNPTNNVIIRNNIFNGTINNNSGATTPLTFFISNNLFVGLNPATFISISQASINNNIFYRSSPQISGGLGNTMNNNISFICPTNLFSAPGTGNLVGVNPMFMSFPVPGALFSYAHDYRLAPGSPGLLSGNDGTDRGVFGGFGFLFNMTGEPAMAEITSFVITSPIIVGPGGFLNISVTSKRIQ